MLQLLPADDCRRILAFLDESGYNYATLTRDGQLTERASRRMGTIDHLLKLTEEPSAFHTLARWFTIGVPMSDTDAAATIPIPILELFERSGMIERSWDSLEPAVMLSPLDTMVLASDPVLRWEEQPSDLVLWPNPTSQQLFNFTIRKPLGSALDFGCGCGIQALGLAQHCESVTGVDLNSRAASFTLFNARLNGFDNIGCVSGDAFEPLAGRTFDLIAANPPFFITPSSGLMYCENSMELDSFCRRIVREAPEHLNEGGILQMVCEWVEIQGQPWRERIEQWCESTGCDCWVIKQYSMKPSAYANERARQRPAPAQSSDEQTFADWVDFYHQKKLAAIHGGLITMRKRSGQNWIRIEDQPVSLESPAGDLILDGIAARDFLDAVTEAGILEARLQLAAQTRLVQSMQPAAPGWRPASLTLQLAGPRRRQMGVEPAVAQFLGQFDGKRQVADLVQQLAQSSGADLDRVASESIAIIRKLLEDGFLELAG